MSSVAEPAGAGTFWPEPVSGCRHLYPAAGTGSGSSLDDKEKILNKNLFLRSNMD